MKKNLLLYGVFLCALSMSSCSGGSKSSHVMDSSSMSVENANEVMKYYDTSLKILKDLVNENEIKAVLGYLDQKMPVDSLPVVSQPVSLIVFIKCGNRPEQAAIIFLQILTIILTEVISRIRNKHYILNRNHRL